MSTERDTHFRGWAKLVQQELDMVFQKQVGFIYSGMTLYNGDEIHRLLEQVLAQRAYDLIYHLIENAPLHSGSFDAGWGSSSEIDEAIKHLPDMAAWPVEPDEPSASNPA